MSTVRAKTKSNGQVGPALPASVAVVSGPPPDPFDQVKSLIHQMGERRYADGFRRACRILAPSIGLLDGESKVKLIKVLDQLELELHAAEAAAK